MGNSRLELLPWKMHYTSHKSLGSTWSLCMMLQPVLSCTSERISWSCLKPCKSINYKTAIKYTCMPYNGGKSQSYLTNTKLKTCILLYLEEHCNREHLNNRSQRITVQTQIILLMLAVHQYFTPSNYVIPYFRFKP